MDIRIQLILLILLVANVAILCIPDPKDAAYNADFKQILLPGNFLVALALAHYASTLFPPLPTGPGSEHNVWVQLQALQTDKLMLSALGGYVAVGVIWAITYFWLYARRLGLKYVRERDAWMVREGLTSLENVPDAAKATFNTVLAAVKAEMLYSGDFPLQPMQQKRFFILNAVIWPVTLLYYMLADFVADTARQVWFALRRAVHWLWARRMQAFIADAALLKQVIDKHGFTPKVCTD